FRHLVVNLLEAVKRGDSFQNSFQNLIHAGLAPEVPNAPIPEEKRSSPFFSTGGAGRFLQSVLAKLRDVGLTLMQIVTNAIKALPKLVKLKPKPIIGWSGPFPTFSLQVDLEAESVSIYDLFMMLKGED